MLSNNKMICILYLLFIPSLKMYNQHQKYIIYKIPIPIPYIINKIPKIF